MPSKRSTSNPSKSKKPSSDPVPEAPNSPNPPEHKNPNPNPGTSKAASPAPAPSSNSKASKKPKPSKMTKDPDSAEPSSPPAAADYDAEADAASPRKSQRKRRAREFPDEETPASASAVAPASTAGSTGSKGSQASQRRWTDDAAVALLLGVVEFRSRTGTTPTPSTMGPFFDSIKASLPPHVTQEQVYNKLRHLRHKYLQDGGFHDTPLYKPSVEAWGAEGRKPNGAPSEENGDADSEERDTSEEGDGAAAYPCLRHELVEYWKKNDLPEELLEMGMTLVDPAKAKALESKWRRHYDAELKLQVKRYDLAKEVFTVLGTAHKGTSS